LFQLKLCINVEARKSNGPPEFSFLNLNIRSGIFFKNSFSGGRIFLNRGLFQGSRGRSANWIFGGIGTSGLFSENNMFYGKSFGLIFRGSVSDKFSSNGTFVGRCAVAEVVFKLQCSRFHKGVFGEMNSSSLKGKKNIGSLINCCFEGVISFLWGLGESLTKVCLVCVSSSSKEF